MEDCWVTLREIGKKTSSLSHNIVFTIFSHKNWSWKRNVGVSNVDDSSKTIDSQAKNFRADKNKFIQIYVTVGQSLCYWNKTTKYGIKPSVLSSTSKVFKMNQDRSCSLLLVYASCYFICLCAKRNYNNRFLLYKFNSKISECNERRMSWKIN